MAKRATVMSLVGCLILGTVSLVSWARSEQESSLTIDQVPAPVKAAILKETAGGEIREIESGTRNGKTIYEVEFVRAGQTIEIAIGADGAMLPVEEDKDTQPKAEEQEREIKEAEVPAAALAALRKLAGDAKFTEFAEEIKYGSKFYEGSWKTAAGHNVDALVTASGDLAEIEEEVPSDQVPAAVLAAVRKLSGADAKLFCEKKTMILYEVKFKKGDERHEVLYAPEGREIEKAVEKGEGDHD